MTRIALCLAVVLALAVPAAAQTGQVGGVITDESGAVLPGVEVHAVLRDANGETTRRVVTDGSGSYAAASLMPGEWLLTASVPGFETATERLTVGTGNSVDWSPTLQVGSLQETVTITTGPAAGPVRIESPRPDDVVAPPFAAPRAAPAGAVRVGGSIKPPRKVVHVNPVYPSDAAAQGIGGVVVLSAVIGTDGLVRNITTVRSPNDSLALAATTAFNGWEFTPTLLNGVPVEVRMTGTFNFQVEAR